MKLLLQTPVLIILSALSVVFLTVNSSFDGLVQMKMGSDGAEVIIDSRQKKSEAPPSLE